MFRTLFVAAIPLFCGHSAFAQLDLTPRPVEYVAEGIKYKQLTFKDGERQIVYEPPVLWAFRDAGANRLVLTPPKSNFAEGVLQAAKLPAPQPLDEHTMSQFREQMLATAPPGAINVTLVSEMMNSITPSGNASYEVTISYHALGEPFLRSGLITNIGSNQLRLQMTAPAKEFDPLRTKLRASLMSWHVEAAATEPAVAAVAIP
jgi:hypothetical protein